MSADEEAVLRANAEFYRAFDAHDLAAMDTVWAREAAVACIHPGWLPLHGRQAVMASWAGILASPNAPAIACSGPAALVFGTSAVVICGERLREGRLAATNVFVHERGAWRLVHHHASPVLDDEEHPGPHELH